MSVSKSSSLAQLAEPRGFASLTGSLLARKGQARPAMRPQLYNFANPAEDDLGWNDLGMDAVPAPENDIQRVQEEIAEAFNSLPAGRAVPGSKGKAAFTLRLTNERHLRLRLASALQRRSAQQVVTDALDRYLLTLPDLEAAMRGECAAGRCAKEIR